MDQPPVKIDNLLEPLLLEINDEEANELLAQLIAVHADPVIKGVIRHKLHLSSSLATQRAEADDVHQDVLLQLLAQLQRFRKLPDQFPITDLRGMAAVIAHRTCSRWMRRQFPERHALKNRLHYLLTHQRGLALWQDQSGKALAGFAVWQREKRPPAKVGEKLPSQTQIRQSSTKQEFAATIVSILDQVGRPVEFDELVSTVANLLGVRDQAFESLPDDEDATASSPVSGEPDPAWQIEKKIFLQRLWEELRELPVNQRAALLLNLKDASGVGCITLFPATGVATLQQLASALEIRAENFAELWNELPLEDSKIAELLSLTRQQVINARKSGRERLARRLKGFF